MTHLIERVAVSLEDGDMLYLCELRDKFKKKAVMNKIEQNGQYIHKEGKINYHIPKLTTQLIASNSRGILLSTILCPHCKSNIIMTIKSILNEDIRYCCNCNKNLYDSKDKKVVKVRW